MTAALPRGILHPDICLLTQSYPPNLHGYSSGAFAPDFYNSFSCPPEYKDRVENNLVKGKGKKLKTQIRERRKQ